jgi:ABC-2 type transport system ATP-binding protein
MSDSPVTIEAQGLTKKYGEFVAISDVTFSITRGQIVAFLGPNGAGKTTTMKILTGYLAPTSGTARIAGFDVATQRLQAAERLGYLPENGPLYQDMTPSGLLRFFGEARGLEAAKLEERLQAVTQLCSIGPVLDKPIYKLSRGYRQRCGMAQALLHEPEVLIMDEPTSGLDPNQIRDVRRTIRELGKSKTVLLSTHILQEVEAVADRVLFIHAGKLVFDGTPSEMRQKGASLDEVFHQLTGAATP